MLLVEYQDPTSICHVAKVLALKNKLSYTVIIFLVHDLSYFVISIETCVSVLRFLFVPLISQRSLLVMECIMEVKYSLRGNLFWFSNSFYLRNLTTLFQVVAL